jgi:hypothetical protein
MNYITTVYHIIPHSSCQQNSSHPQVAPLGAATFVVEIKPPVIGIVKPMLLDGMTCSEMLIKTQS